MYTCVEGAEEWVRALEVCEFIYVLYKNIVIVCMG